MTITPARCGRQPLAVWPSRELINHDSSSFHCGRIAARPGPVRTRTPTRRAGRRTVACRTGCDADTRTITARSGDAAGPAAPPASTSTTARTGWPRDPEIGPAALRRHACAPAAAGPRAPGGRFSGTGRPFRPPRPSTYAPHFRRFAKRREGAFRRFPRAAPAGAAVPSDPGGGAPLGPGVGTVTWLSPAAAPASGGHSVRCGQHADRSVLRRRRADSPGIPGGRRYRGPDETPASPGAILPVAAAAGSAAAGGPAPDARIRGGRAPSVGRARHRPAGRPAPARAHGAPARQGATAGS